MRRMASKQSWPALAQARHPFRVEVLHAQRTVALGPRLDGQQVQHPLQPARDLRALFSDSMCDGKHAAFDLEVVVEPVDPGINQPDHVLRAAGLGFALVFGLVEFAHQLRPAGGLGSRPSTVSAAMARVPLAMPERSIGRKVGSICTTTIEPGGLGLWRETNGWSIQPPASCRRLGIAPRHPRDGSPSCSLAQMGLSQCPRAGPACACRYCSLIHW